MWSLGSARRRVERIGDAARYVDDSREGCRRRPFAIAGSSRSRASGCGMSPRRSAWRPGLYRWMRQPPPRAGRFRPVAVVPPASRPADAGVVVLCTPSGPRIEGLDIESAARLVVLVR
jgi:hypothetical protein